jgi:hypothetical protein
MPAMALNQGAFGERVSCTCAAELRGKGGSIAEVAGLRRRVGRCESACRIASQKSHPGHGLGHGKL